MALQRSATSVHRIPAFRFRGAPQTVATLNSWLHRYSTAAVEPEPLTVSTDAERAQGQNPEMVARLQEFERWHQAGESITVEEMERLTKDLRLS